MKKQTIKALTGLAAVMLTSVFSQAQDERFSQFFGNPLRLNPAIMGANTDMKFTLGYRSQWAAIDKGYTTYSFTGMYPVFVNGGKGKLDIGLSVLNDKAGAFNTMDAALAVDYNKQIAPDNNLCLSLLGGFVQKSLSTANLSFDNQYVLGSYNASNPSNETTLGTKVSYPDAGFGLMWYMNPSPDKAKLNAYAGISGYHLNQPNQSLIGGSGKLPIRISYQGGVKIFGENHIDVVPNARVSIQNGNVETAVGLNLDYSFSDNAKLVIGAWYRGHDAIAALVGFEHKNFVFGYSYDMVSSALSKVATGVNAHEIILSFKLSRLSKMSTASTSESSGSNNPSVRTSPFNTF